MLWCRPGRRRVSPSVAGRVSGSCLLGGSCRSFLGVAQGRDADAWCEVKPL